MRVKKIHQLDEKTIHKIAAGEVIDRPSSVIKECLENSLDAGATKIQITINSGGKKRIQVTDNGCGISVDDLPLVPIRHATSKITSIEDLYAVESFGFRGEAIASICHVATVKMVSKISGESAYGFTAIFGDISNVTPNHHEAGTTITVDHLFENIPVRAKFLKSDTTEATHCYGVVLHYALTHPACDFTLISDGKELLNTIGISDQSALIVHLLGKSAKDKLVPVDFTFQSITIKGYISDPTLSFSNRNKQFIAVNHRAIKSPVIQSAIMQSFRDIIVHRRHPLIVLSFTLPPDTLDVNIHPQKMDIKFLNSGFIFDCLKKAIYIALQPQGHASSQREISLSADGNNMDLLRPSAEPTSEALQQNNSSETRTADFWHSYQNPTHTANVVDALKESLMVSTPQSLYSPSELSHVAKDHIEFLQLFDTYIIIKGPDALWMLDQHAVHERILYEKYKASFSSENAKQPLLIAESVELSPDLYAICLENKHVFEALNFDIEDFGNNHITIREVPLEFAEANVVTLLLKLLDDIKAVPGQSLADITLEFKEVLQMKACKAAIKAGKRLHKKEVVNLVQDFIKSPSNYTCPHGRPLFVKYAKSDLEKLFLRA